jgi:diaminopimelate epimerase
MQQIPFTKYTSFGNNFVIVDETQGPVLSEADKQGFAYRATDQCFGIGSDNFLVIQRCTVEILREINACHRYWDELPEAGAAEYIFRMFEPNGTEAYSCGNGLLCIAGFLYRRYGIESTRILTQVPSSRPRVVSIGADPASGTHWANMGEPRAVPAEMVDRSALAPCGDHVDLVEEIAISHFRSSDAVRFFGGEKSVTLTGYLVFTGEPHLVVFADSGFSLAEMPSSLFPVESGRTVRGQGAEKRLGGSCELVQFIGDYFAREYADLFPAGININFVRTTDVVGTLEYRCYERGINRETLACGTGALAVAYVARKLNVVDGETITIWPHRCRWYDDDAAMSVQETPDGWVLYGRPNMLFEGLFSLGSPSDRAPAFPFPIHAGLGSDLCDLQFPARQDMDLVPAH